MLFWYIFSMAQFVSSFITGFQDVVKADLHKRFPGIKILNIFDGLIHYQFDGNSRDLDKIIYFNNTFFVLKVFKLKNPTFNAMVGEIASSKNYFLISKGTFRCRFIQENQFAKVDKNIVKKAEEAVLRNSKLTIDRLSPSTEVWYNIRRDGFAFCGQLISKREFTEKNLNKGELRPEFAYLMCAFAQIEKDAIVAEPFCGYGSIPIQLAKKIQFNKLYVSDIDDEKIAVLKNNKHLQKENIELSKQDAFALNNIEENSISVVITDPPWGYYEDISDIKAFYDKMFVSFRRILKADGKMIILSARKEDIEKAASDNGVTILETVHTLVNGKKAALYKMCF